MELAWEREDYENIRGHYLENFITSLRITAELMHHDKQ